MINSEAHSRLTGSAYPNSAKRYLFNIAPYGADLALMLMLMLMLEVML